MSAKTEAVSRVESDALLRDTGWRLTDGSSVLYEHTLADGTRSDYVLCDRQVGRWPPQLARRAGSAALGLWLVASFPVAN